MGWRLGGSESICSAVWCGQLDPAGGCGEAFLAPALSSQGTRDRGLRPPGACCPPATLRLVPTRAGLPSERPAPPASQPTRSGNSPDVHELKKGQKVVCPHSGVIHAEEWGPDICYRGMHLGRLLSENTAPKVTRRVIPCCGLNYVPHSPLLG